MAHATGQCAAVPDLSAQARGIARVARCAYRMGDMRTVVTRAPRGVIGFWALAGVALLVSHDAVFAVQAGPGRALTDALRDGGHGYWGVASALIAAAGLIVGLLAAARLSRLRRRAHEVGAVPITTSRTTSVLRAWAWLFLIASAGFLVQENLEHLAMHGHLIGAGALVGPEYPLALPVIASITLAAGIIGGLIGDRESALLEAITTALAGIRHRPVHAVRRTEEVAVAGPSVLARRGAGRAPPGMALSF
jgi:hypothetical protein